MAGLDGEQREVLEAVHTLLGEVTHELRTPLTVILGHAELIDQGDGVSVHASAQAIIDAARGINLALSRRGDELRAQLGVEGSR